MPPNLDPHLADNLRRWRDAGGPRRWVDARLGRWGHDEWLALLDDLRRSPYAPLDPDAVGLALEEARVQRDNLRQWERSGRARQWVADHGGRWDHEDWLRLLHDLSGSPFWPLDAAAVGEVLEDIAREWRNVRRWHESGEARRWLADRGGAWSRADWPALRCHLRQGGFWPADPEAVEAVLDRLAAEEVNLRRWVESGAARAWVAARHARWDHGDWLTLLDGLRRSEFWPLDAAALGQALDGLKVEWWNLRRWRASGLARRWVEARWGQWGEAEWQALLAGLRASAFWPIDLGALARVLEDVRREWWNLRRWVLSGEPRRWVTAHGPLWGAADYRGLLESLRKSRWWPLDPYAVRQLLEAVRAPPDAAAA